MAPAKKYVSEFERGQIIGAHIFQHSIREIECRFKIPKSTVQRIISEYKNGKLHPLSRCGRPKKTTPQTDRVIRRLATRTAANRRSTLGQITGEINAGLNTHISEDTVSRRLHEHGIHSRKPTKVQATNPKNRLYRLQWGRDHALWTLEDWKKVLFSDESRISLDGPDGGIRIWRTKDEAMHPDCMHSTSNFSRGVMVWGCVSWLGLGPLIILDGPVTGHSYSELITTHVYPTLIAMYEDIDLGIFQQDNAAPHTSAIATQTLEHLGIRTLQWPAHSPDLSPIENIWREFKNRLKKGPNPPTSIAQLRDRIDQEWTQLARETNCWRKFVENMPARISALRKSRGFPIKH